MQGEDLRKRVSGVAGANLTFEQSQTAYTSWASKYEEDLSKQGYIAHNLTSQYVCKVVPRESRGKMRVIDIGAGTGLVARRLREEGFQHIDALEPNKAMLDVARNQNLYDTYLLEFITEKPCSRPENARSLPYDISDECLLLAVVAFYWDAWYPVRVNINGLDINAYDVLTGSGIYAAGAHVPCEALREMIRLVKPGGYIVLTSRTNLLEDGMYKNLDQLMDKLEADGKWKKIARDIPGKLYLDYDAIVWQYQKL